MNLVYGQANALLIDEFEEMKNAYSNDLEEYDDGDVNSCYTLYEREFTPFVLKHIKENNAKKLKQIFDFVEKLMSSDDAELINMVAVAVIESLYFDNAREAHKDILLKYCGEKTLLSFKDCLSDEEKAEWENPPL